MHGGNGLVLEADPLEQPHVCESLPSRYETSLRAFVCRHKPSSFDKLVFPRASCVKMHRAKHISNSLLHSSQCLGRSVQDFIPVNFDSDGVMSMTSFGVSGESTSREREKYLDLYRLSEKEPGES